MPGRVFNGHEDGTTPFAANTEALDQTQDHQEDGRGNTDRGVAGQQADRDCGTTHHEQRQHEHLLATDPVAEVPEHQTTHGPGDERHREGRKGAHLAGHRAEAGEELVVEHQHRRGAEEEVVVPLDRRAEEAGKGNFGWVLGGFRS